MARILVTNDDGVDSPTLVPLTRAMRELGETRVVVPDLERSWIGKAITRYGPVQSRDAERDGVSLVTVSGTPADCVSIAVHDLLTEPPDLVVSGINMGLNYGICFVLSSGTIGAAIEAWITGARAIAFSMAIPGDAYGVKHDAEHADLAGGAARAAAVALDITRDLLAVGFPDGVDLISVNMPAAVDLETPRVITKISRSRYGKLFVSNDGAYTHKFHQFRVLDSNEDGDVPVVDRGEVSITPIRLDLSTAVPEPFRTRLERRAT